MFWLFAFALTLTVALAILRPFWRARPATAEPAASYDLRVYRDQLTEVDRDLARGIITPAEAERLRVEIGRKVLEADRTLSRDSTAPGVMQRHAVIASIVLRQQGYLSVSEPVLLSQVMAWPLATRLVRNAVAMMSPVL